MGERITDASKWEEDTYWNHFFPIRFSLILNHGFHQQLAIPKKFSDNMKKLQNTVALKGPSGVTWDIGLIINEDGRLFFKYGWQEFVKDHSLRENDHLVFIYNRDSQFDVLVFDGQSLCEKEASYFVRKGAKKPEHLIGDDGGCSTQRKISEVSCEEIQLPSKENIENASSNKSENDESMSLAPLNCKRPRNKRARRNVPSVQLVTDTNMNKAYKTEYASNRRPIREDEKKNARELALTASREKSFMVVMTPTHVYKSFCLGVPREWIKKNLSKKNQNIILRLGEKTWHAGFRYREDRNWGGISCGWKQFAIDNNLEEFDVCLFEPSAGLIGATLLDVKIFRVVDEFTPLVGFSSATPKSRGKKLRKASQS